MPKAFSGGGGCRLPSEPEWEDASRGGSWYGKPSYLHSANRFWYANYFRNNNLGFRLALTPGE